MLQFVDGALGVSKPQDFPPTQHDSGEKFRNSWGEVPRLKTQGQTYSLRQLKSSLKNHLMQNSQLRKSQGGEKVHSGV